MFIGVVLLLLIAAELLRGVRPGRTALIVVFACSGLATLGNLAALRDAFRNLEGYPAVVRGGTGGLEIARDPVEPEFLLTAENSDFDYFTLVDAESYLSAVDEFGSPAYSVDELPSAPESARAAADKVVASALGLEFEPLNGPLPAACLSSSAGGHEPRVLELPTGGAAFALPPGAEGRLRRYASESFPVEIGALPEGESLLEIPTDRSSEPWELELTAAGPVTVCPL